MFIRTKDRILEVTKDTKEKKFIVCGKTLLDYGTFITSEDDIIKQSDNLAYLCDEFLIMDNGRCMEIFSNYDNLKSSGWYRSDIDIYGAIYTDKGLIYVAKMNENGKLVLI